MEKHMIRIAIVEDQMVDQKRMKEYVELYFRGREEEPEIFIYEDGDVFLDEYPAPLDLILMDIEMQRMDGLKAAHRLRAFDPRVQLLFVTNLVKFALEGYAVDAADFIVKPVRYPVFCSSMDRVMRKIRADSPRFLVTQQGKETVYCPVQEITYIESLNKKTIIHQKGGAEVLSQEALYALEEKLQQEPFFRCHNAFLVNFRHIRTMHSSEVIVNDVAIPVSKYRKKEFLQALANYQGRML
jgi:DNA-binding LytR/AlgR family response regulator